MNGFEDEEESETTGSFAGSDRSPPKSISRSQSWPEYSSPPSEGSTDLDLGPVSPPSSPLSSEDSQTHSLQVQEEEKVLVSSLELMDLISSLPQRQRSERPQQQPQQGSLSSFDRSICSDQRDQLSHGWMTHSVTTRFRSLSSSSSSPASLSSYSDIFGTHNIASPSLRSQMQTSDSAVVARALLSNRRYPPKYIHRFKKGYEEKKGAPSEEGTAEVNESADLPNEEADSSSQVMTSRATLKRPLLPLRHSISLTLRASFGRFLGSATQEMLSSTALPLPTGLEAISSSLRRNSSHSPDSQSQLQPSVSPPSSPPPSPSLSLSSASAQRALVLRSQRIKRIRDRKPLGGTRELPARVLLRRKEVSRRILSPEELSSAEDLLLASQSQTLREMQNRVAKLTRSLLPPPFVILVLSAEL
jgi:hypothetical protein